MPKVLRRTCLDTCKTIFDSLVKFTKVHRRSCFTQVKSQPRHQSGMRFVTSASIVYIVLYIMFSSLSKQTQYHKHTAQLSCNLDVPKQSLGHSHAILHLTKEMDDIAPFGGVGKVIKGMTQSQIHKRDVFILLPRYSFIEHGERFCQLDIHFGQQTQDSGNIYWFRRDNIHYLLIGALKSCPHLWQIADFVTCTPYQKYVHRKISSWRPRPVFYIYSRIFYAHTVQCNATKFSMWYQLKMIFSHS